MPDILHSFPIRAAAGKVFDAISTPAGLDSWWTSHAAGKPAEGAEYQLGFGPDYEWRATVSRFVPPTEFELHLTRCDPDWQDTRVRFRLEPDGGLTRVRFEHAGWGEANDHYQVSCYCWAMYLRLLRLYLETGQTVAYEERLEA